VATRLTPGGTIFFLDARREPASTARDHELPAVGDEVMTRRLDDGREFSIVKNFWSAADLTVACRRAGLDVDVRETEDYFQFGVGRRGLPATAG
jgi:demethylmenaquinone methyltransferase/2-methoxy-6-polyprenyl-1,4-benzoquinol methylase